MIKDDELIAFIDYIYESSGYDFRNYSHASLERRVAAFRAKYRFDSMDHLREALLKQQGLMRQFVENMTVQVTEVFRDPSFYRAIREYALPVLSTYPRIKIWHAGCSNGAEVYSMAILMHEAGLLERTRFYATDINEEALKQAYDGVYPLKDMQQFTRNYQLAGGESSFADYYRADSQSAIMDRRLKENMTFSFHNLATDWVFTEAHMVVCRNVLIYFNKALQDRALELFEKSLVRRGLLALGTKESLRFSSVSDHFENVEAPNRIFRLKGPP